MPVENKYPEHLRVAEAITERVWENDLLPIYNKHNPEPELLEKYHQTYMAISAPIVTDEVEAIRQILAEGGETADALRKALGL